MTKCKDALHFIFFVLQSFDIKVLPMDNGTPVLHTNLGLQFLEHSNGQVCYCGFDLKS